MFIYINTNGTVNGGWKVKLMHSPQHIKCSNSAVKRCRDYKLPVVAELHTRDTWSVFTKCHKAEPSASIP